MTRLFYLIKNPVVTSNNKYIAEAKDVKCRVKS
jgi:hypothetical protein